MEKKMNLLSMLFIFMCVVGFDYFYNGVMHINPSSLTDADYAPMTPPTIMMQNTHHKIAKIK